MADRSRRIRENYLLLDQVLRTESTQIIESEEVDVQSHVVPESSSPAAATLANPDRFSIEQYGAVDFAADLQAKLHRTHIPALDGLRAIAVFLVIFYHFGFSGVPGGRGVTAFFVLSGFLITWLLLKENEKSGTVSLSGFYMRRVLRIFPAFYCYWTLLIILLLLKHQVIPWPHAWSSVFYTSNYYVALNGDPENGFSHTWSLAIEEQFYLLWPLAFLMWRRNLARLTAHLVCIIGAVWLYRALLVFLFKVDQAYIYAAFDTRLDHLMVGCLLAVVLKRGVLFSFWKAVCSNVYLPLLTVALLAASIFLGGLFYDRYRDVFGFAVEPILFAVLVIQLIRFCSSLPWKWIEWPVLRYLGRISYSLYLYQQIILYPVRRVLATQPVVLQVAAAIILTVIVASASYYLIERPFLKFKNVWANYRRPVVATA
jgi:peptidoglycan/LPS O-acetylase OafA/YrhL